MISNTFWRKGGFFHGSRAKTIYEYVSRRTGSATDFRFMNYGYAGQETPHTVDLLETDEFERYPAQLYHKVATQVDLAGKDLLDVGSGRGGGAGFMHKYLKPATTTGLDLANNAVSYCREMDKGIEGLFFVQGDATAMPFDDNSFDVITNVESAHCYPDKQAFLSEVARVLRPGGAFLMTDFTKPDLPMEMDFEAAGLTEVGQSDITGGVLRALDLDDDRRSMMIRKLAPFGLRKFFSLWAGSKGSWIYKDFAQKKRKYIVYHLEHT